MYLLLNCGHNRTSPFSCGSTLKFWQEVTKWTRKILEVTFNLTISEILFGMPLHGVINLFIINSLIIH